MSHGCETCGDRLCPGCGEPEKPTKKTAELTLTHDEAVLLLRMAKQYVRAGDKESKRARLLIERIENLRI